MNYFGARKGLRADPDEPAPTVRTYPSIEAFRGVLLLKTSKGEKAPEEAPKTCRDHGKTACLGIGTLSGTAPRFVGTDWVNRPNPLLEIGRNLLRILAFSRQKGDETQYY